MAGRRRRSPVACGAAVPFISEGPVGRTEGMVDDIIRLLSGLKELVVIARSSTLTFALAPLDLRRIGHELDVRYVLHGSLHRAGARIRIAMELNEAESGHLIWADRLDGELSDLSTCRTVSPRAWSLPLHHMFASENYIAR